MKQCCRSSFKTIKSLNLDERSLMADLYLTYYDNADEAMFFRDLDAKTEVDIIYSNGEMAGFSTLLLYETEWQGCPIRIAYSGDTLVRKRHWGQQALQIAWLKRIGQLCRETPLTPFYWFLLVKGHRTYRFLPSFVLKYHPNPDNEHTDLKKLADKLACDKFGADYNSCTGVVEFETSQGNLKEEVAHPTERELNNHAVKFFLKKNPGYLRGHELVCICPICTDNLKPFARRIFEDERS